MQRIKAFLVTYFGWINKYVLITLIFFIATFFVKDSNFIDSYRYNLKVKELEKEIEAYKIDTEIKKDKLKKYYTDKNDLERVAREEFFMRKENEDVYIIK